MRETLTCLDKYCICFSGLASICKAVTTHLLFSNLTQFSNKYQFIDKKEKRQEKDKKKKKNRKQVSKQNYIWYSFGLKINERFDWIFVFWMLAIIKYTF